MSILLGNQMEKALERVGFKSTRKTKKPKHKKFACKICGSPMTTIENTNVMTCSNDKCANYYIFDID